MENLILSLAFTSHVGVGCCYNEVHPNVRYYLNDRTSIGAYYNSEFSVSPYLTYQTEGNPSLELGLVGGYSFGFVIPYGRLNYNVGRYTYFIAPATGNNSIGLVIGVEIRN